MLAGMIGLNPNALTNIFSGLRVGNLTLKDAPNVTMKSLYDEYLKIWEFEMRGIEHLLGRAYSVSGIACAARYRGSSEHAAASGRFGLVRHERVDSREGLVQ